MFQVTFPEVARVLQSLQSSVAAAESHGCLCGAFCTVQQYPVESWLDELVPDLEEDPADDRATLRLLFADTVRALRGDEMEFQLLLPDDDAPLVERAMALSQWCQGFLYGLGAGSITDASELPGEVGEVVRDFIEISHAAVDAESGEESNENAYTELVEFVRVGVQLLFEELASARRPGAPTATPLH